MIQFSLYFFCICLCIVTYIVNRRETLKKLNGIPTLPHLPIVGCAHMMFRSNGREFYRLMMDTFKKYGDKFYFEIELRKHFIFSNKRDVQAILTNKKFVDKVHEYDYFLPWMGQSLFTTSGNLWRSKRKGLYSFFNTRTVEHLISKFELHSDQFLKALEKHDSLNGFDVFPIVQAYAMDMILEVSLGMWNNSHVKVTSLQHNIEEIIRIIMWRIFHLIARFDCGFRLTSNYKIFNQMITESQNYILDHIANKKTLVKNNGLTSKDAKSFIEYLCCLSEKDNSITNEIILNELQLIIFAGLDTTTGSLSFLLYNLAKYPEVQEKVFTEIRDNIETNVPLTVKSINKLNYLDMVVKESWRMYPAVPVIGRTATEDVNINDVNIPAGSTVAVGILFAHMNEDNFPEPEKFRPERHDILRSEEMGNSYNLFTFSPGVRSCIGSRVAEYEIKTLIIKLLNEYKLELKEGYEPDISWDVVIKPYNGVWIKLQKRQ